MYPKLEPITRNLIIANVVIFFLQQIPVVSQWIAKLFMLWPMNSGFLPWQLLTYGFLHEGFGHLFFNMLTIYMFGSALELTWGQKRYLQYFLVCIVGAGVIQFILGLIVTKMGYRFPPTLGASGGVYGLLIGYGMIFPNQRIMLLFPPIPMKARTLVIIIGGTALLFGIIGAQSGVAHFAHLGGMLTGWLLIRYWRGNPPFNRRKKQHFTIVP